MCVVKVVRDVDECYGDPCGVHLRRDPPEQQLRHFASPHVRPSPPLLYLQLRHIHSSADHRSFGFEAAFYVSFSRGFARHVFKKGLALNRDRTGSSLRYMSYRCRHALLTSFRLLITDNLPLAFSHGGCTNVSFRAPQASGLPLPVDVDADANAHAPRLDTVGRQYWYLPIFTGLLATVAIGA